MWRIGFNNSGVMNSTNDGNSFKLAAAAPSSDCSPLTEVYNASGNGGTGQDLLFLSVSANGFNTGTLNCGNSPCIMSFDITSGFPTTAKSVAALHTTNSTIPFGIAATNAAMATGGIVIDNVSTSAGAAQIYFGSLNSSTGEQLSQSGLE